VSCVAFGAGPLVLLRSNHLLTTGSSQR